MTKKNDDLEIEYVIKKAEASPEIALRLKLNGYKNLEQSKVSLMKYILEEAGKRINALIIKEKVTLQGLGFRKDEQHGIVVFYIKEFEHTHAGFRIYMSKTFKFYTVYKDCEKLFDNEDEDEDIPIELLELHYAILNEWDNMRQDYLSKKDNGRK